MVGAGTPQLSSLLSFLPSVREFGGSSLMSPLDTLLMGWEAAAASALVLGHPPLPP